MPTLLLRLFGPMQSWGTQSRFSIRDTGLEPSKSGVIGLLCAALGKSREERPNDGWPTLAVLVALRMGVRVDREGVMKADYHTAGGTPRQGDPYGVMKADGKSRGTVTSQRYYLSDADFLVGLESDEIALLRQLNDALAQPHWQLSLGRKSFVPSLPVWVPDALREASLRDALSGYSWQGDKRHEPPDRLRLVVEATPETAAEVRQDVPLSFAERRFTIRYVTTDYVPRPEGDEACISLA
ncbi:MAG: type I-E CRISPR-associated protein Cas5/CasD [Pyrinomonadaceae bacterium]|nr:type I-E CRISPR-associated protein Cas5/CasD [Pyrinomonadaceae bacterium]